MSSNAELRSIYARRFKGDDVFRRDMWRVLTADFFQRYIRPDSAVLEIGAGYCEFINAVRAGRKFAVDLNEDTRRYAAPDVKVISSSSTDLSRIPAGSIDVAFASNFLEHLQRDDIKETIRQVAGVLRPGGRFLILQPNYRYCYRDYWMFFDHITPLDHRSLAEVLETNGFEVKDTIVRFLPYTTKSRFPRSVALVRAYLRFPLLWRFLGGQTFMIAEVRS